MAYLPAIFQRLNRSRIPWIGLLAAFIVGCVLFAPFPSWYSIVSVASSTIAVVLVMSGIGLRVLRRTAPDLPRLYRLGFASDHAEARQLVRAKRQAVAKVLADQQREEARLVREQAGVEVARLRSGEAAQLYEQAVGLLPAEDHDQRGADLVSACLQWTHHGRDRGDNQALATEARS